MKLSFFCTDFKCVGISIDHLRLLETDVQNLLAPLLNKEVVSSGTGVHHPNGSYFVNDIVMLEIKNDNYVFGKIQKLFFIRDIVYVLCEEFHVAAFNTHFHAYDVVATGIYVLIKLTELLDYHVLGIYEIEQLMLIPLKHSVLKF